MPSKSKAQSRLMHGVASGSIKGSGVPKKVAQEYTAADAGRSQAKLPERKMSDVVAPKAGGY